MKREKKYNHKIGLCPLHDLHALHGEKYWLLEKSTMEGMKKKPPDITEEDPASHSVANRRA